MNRDLLIIAVCLSVLLHLGFGVVASGIRLPAPYREKVRPRRFFRVKVIKPAPTKPQPVVRRRPVDKTLTFKAPSPVSLSRKFKDVKASVQPKKTQASLPDQKLAPPPSPVRKKRLPWQVKKDTRLVSRTRRTTRKTLLKKVKGPGKNTFATPKEILKEADVTEDFFDKMPGLTPALIGEDGGVAGLQATPGKKRRLGLEGEEQGESYGYTPVIQKKRQLKGMEEYLGHELMVYTDPADGQKYYRLRIRAGHKARALPAMSKEIIFLLDCSISTQADRLEEFKRGILYGLDHLNANDFFNIIAFKKDLYFFRSKPVVADPRTKAEAMRFVEALTAGEKTDAYTALYKTIQEKHLRRPSYLIFLSDGRPTKGVVDSRRLINEISALNRGKVVIFSFSGGMRVNRYLLDFLAYKNRGWAEYSYRTHLIGETLAQFYDKIRDPILLNPRYYVSGLDRENIYPRILPDFFRNTEFTLYGRYTNETDFSLQILGERDGKTREFFMKGSLAEAKKGGEDIVRGWAFNKIYHLISRLRYGGDNTAIIAEIRALSRKFRIKTPYGRTIFGR